jgi:RNA polymerase sigma-70 factor (ECF subfamily)
MSNQSNRPVDWMEKTVERNESKLFRTALAIVGGKADAEDVVQDVFVKLFEKQPSFESSEHETAWLIRVAVNLCRNRLRSHWWTKTVPLLDTYPAQTGEQQEIMQTVLSLPAKYRTVIHLFYYEGYSTKEIAEITAQKESTVREQLTRARRMLRKFLEGEAT